MAAPGEALTQSGYIAHHLSNLDDLWKVWFGWKMAQRFWNVHIDSLFFSWFTGLIFLRNFLQSSKESNSRCTG